MPYTLTLGSVAYRGDAASERLFGGNVIFTQDYVDVGGAFEWVVDTLGLRTLRFPGGTVTETLFSPGAGFVDTFFDVTNPDGFDPDGSGRILTVPAMFQFAASRDLPVQFVLPTDNYLSSQTDADGNRLPSAFGLYRLVDRADRILRGEYGDVTVDTFLLGNEFWYLDQRLTPTEYGRFANELIKGLQFVFDRYREEQPDPDAWVEPNIAIQAGRGWIPLENQQVLAQLDMEARGSVDTVLQHFYPVYYQHVANSRGIFDRMDEFQNAPGFGELNYYMSEWNTFLNEAADKGLMQASTLLETMRTMMLRGVDEATIWGIQYQQLNGRLATRITNPDGTWESQLLAGGELFRMMNPGIIGMQVLDIDTPAALRSHLLERPEDRPAESRDQAVMHAWGNDQRTIVFLSSRTDTTMEFTLNMQGLIPADWHSAWLLQMGAMDNPATALDESDGTKNYARPHLTTQSGEEFSADSTFNITLGAWEVARLEFLHGDEGARMWSQEFLVDPAVDHSETMIGSRNNDTIFGGLGNDTLFGRAGDDILFGGPGNNLLFGEEGDDLLVGFDGRNTLTGGTGIDRFAASVLGTNVITDFTPEEGETLSFLGRYANADEMLENTTTTVASWSGSGPAEDLIITHVAGGQTVLLGGARLANSFSDSISDFEPGSETTAQLQGLGVYEVPIARPDIPEPTVRDTLLLNEITRLAQEGSPQDFAAALNDFTPEQLADFVDQINPTIFSLYTLTPLGFLLNTLDNDAVDNFMDRVWPGTFDRRVDARLALGERVVIRNDYAFLKIFEKHSPEFGVRLASNPNQAHQDHLSVIFRVLERNGVDPKTLALFRDLDVQQDENGLFFVNRPPPPEEEEPPPSIGGPECFVATAVYGDRLHPDVAALRWFRYEILARSWAGRLACHVYYYHAGPWLAHRLADHPKIRGWIRAALHRIARAIRIRHGPSVWEGGLK